MKGILNIFASVKRGRIVILFFTIFLSAILLAGSSGVSVIIKHCHLHGYSVSTGILHPASLSTDRDCCGHYDSHCAPEATDKNTVSCCTYVTEKIKLANYLSSGKLITTPLFDFQTVTFADPEVSYSDINPRPILHHNKHGGRELSIEFRQLLI
ncbi:MAG: hypothetical protein MUD02_08670 [Bacteroidales bacterium]|nr:hypothetical protein [Bacteroidales bacterium]